MNLNKGISTPIAILLIVVVAATVGVLVWQFRLIGKPDSGSGINTEFFGGRHSYDLITEESINKLCRKSKIIEVHDCHDDILLGLTKSTNQSYWYFQPNGEIIKCAESANECRNCCSEANKARRCGSENLCEVSFGNFTGVIKKDTDWREVTVYSIKEDGKSEKLIGTIGKLKLNDYVGQKVTVRATTQVSPPLSFPYKLKVISINKREDI